jgi:hypothetical protein
MNGTELLHLLNGDAFPVLNLLGSYASTEQTFDLSNCPGPVKSVRVMRLGYTLVMAEYVTVDGESGHKISVYTYQTDDAARYGYDAAVAVLAPHAARHATTPVEDAPVMVVMVEDQPLVAVADMLAGPEIMSADGLNVRFV